MRKSFFLFFLAALPLASCGADYFFDATPDLSKEYLADRNGDLLDYSGLSTYESVGDFRSADALITAFENGESGLFLFAQYTCEACLNFEPSFASYAINSRADVTTIYRDGSNDAEFSAALSKLSAYFETSFSNTPTFFAGKKGFFSTVSWGSNNESYLRNSVNSQASFTNIYRFGTAGAYEKEAKESILSFFYSSTDAAATDFYASTLYPLAKASAKRLYLIDYDRLSGDDRSAICKDLSLNDGIYSPVVALNGTVISVTEKSASALVKGYYS
jgi:hypothetical protein